MKDINYLLIIVIIYDEYTFFTNNGKTHKSHYKRDTFLFFTSIYSMFLKKNKIKLLNIIVF